MVRTQILTFFVIINNKVPSRTLLTSSTNYFNIAVFVFVWMQYTKLRRSYRTPLSQVRRGEGGEVPGFVLDSTEIRYMQTRLRYIRDITGNTFK
jgi:hypothetical protein